MSTRVTTPEQVKTASLEELERTICTIDGVGREMKKLILVEIKHRTAMSVASSFTPSEIAARDRETVS